MPHRMSRETVGLRAADADRKAVADISVPEPRLPDEAGISRVRGA
jgi:hypothetical protein